MFYPKNKNKRSQELRKAFHDAAQFYLGKAKNFLDKSEVFSKNSKPIILSRNEAVDIDTKDDWKITELLFKYKN
jgi:CMP-N-acetylneuraminic acid synthetase